MKLTMRQARIGSKLRYQAATAQALGMSESKYRKLEAAPGNITYNEAVAFAEVTGVTLEDIDFSRA